MPALPVRPLIPPEQVMLFIEEVRQRLTPISVDEEEYFATIQKISEQGFTSSRVYDARLLRCAVKAKAESIHAWNVQHFRAIAPELAGRICTP